MTLQAEPACITRVTTLPSTSVPSCRKSSGARVLLNWALAAPSGPSCPRPLFARFKSPASQRDSSRDEMWFTLLVLCTQNQDACE